MRFADQVRLGLSSIVANRLRSVLTMLGILIGISSVILLTSIGEGVRSFILGSFTQFGTNIVSVAPGKLQTSGSPGALAGTTRKLTLGDAEAIERLWVVEDLVPVIVGSARVQAGERGRSVFIFGTNDKVPEVWTFQVGLGRFLPPGDWRRPSSVTVLGPKLKRELFGEENALGRHVRIGGRRFLVVGIMKPVGQFLGNDMDDCAYVPVASAAQIFDQDGLISIDIRFKKLLSESVVIDTITKTMLERHDGEEDFNVISQTAMLDVLDNVLGVVSIAIGGIAGISLVVGALGILTMMWISVHERTAEIGLAKALGATGTQVLLLFLGEAIILSAFGGALGVGVGLGLARLLALVVPGLPVVVPHHFVVAALVISVLVGLLSGVLPARRAAELDPVEALRAE
ncbi:MAG: ABC transporter permease [Acidobacteriota bacterium]